MSRHTLRRVASSSNASSVRWRPIVVFLGLFACLLWSYWPTVVDLCRFWLHNQDYSAGALVPIVAVYLVWRKRAALSAEPVKPCWWGLALLALAEAMRHAGLYFGVGSGERYALAVAIVGAALTAAGSRAARKLAWIFVFLFLMIPLPARMHDAIAQPLQAKATASAAIVLELLGFFVTREGNVLRLNDEASVAVAEACSGLRMLTAFVFIAAVLAFVIDRPRWQKLTLALFSVPIALLSNTIRLVATSLFIYYGRNMELSEKFHDAAGLAMMPLALFFSVLLLKFLAFLTRPLKPRGRAEAADVKRLIRTAGATRSRAAICARNAVVSGVERNE